MSKTPKWNEVGAPQDIPDESEDEISYKEDANLEQQEKRINLDSLQQNVEERKSYATKIHWRVIVWLGALLTILVRGGQI